MVLRMDGGRNAQRRPAGHRMAPGRLGRRDIGLDYRFEHPPLALGQRLDVTHPGKLGMPGCRHQRIEPEPSFGRQPNRRRPTTVAHPSAHQRSSASGRQLGHRQPLAWCGGRDSGAPAARASSSSDLATRRRPTPRRALRAWYVRPFAHVPSPLACSTANARTVRDRDSPRRSSRPSCGATGSPGAPALETS